MEVSSCGKQEGVIPRYILAMGTTIDYLFFFFFKVNTVTLSVHNVCRFVPSVSHFLDGSVDCKTVSFSQNRFSVA